MTISSFTSLALRPAPVVAFNIALPSRTLDALAASRQFNVHVLAGTPQGAAVAELFTRGNADEDAVFERLSGEGGGGEDEEGCRLAAGAALGGEEDIAGVVGLPPPPMLVGPGVLYVLRCRLVDEPSDGLVKVQDHVIVLGEVLAIEEGQPVGKKAAEAGAGERGRVGLAYSNRRYRRQGAPLEPGEDKQ
jgi:flavin reductase (DIM6/NTAB) family NADH-FMN oxidoreductase RutF